MSDSIEENNDQQSQSSVQVNGIDEASVVDLDEREGQATTEAVSTSEDVQLQPDMNEMENLSDVDLNRETNDDASSHNVHSDDADFDETGNNVTHEGINNVESTNNDELEHIENESVSGDNNIDNNDITLENEQISTTTDLPSIQVTNDNERGHTRNSSVISTYSNNVISTFHLTKSTFETILAAKEIKRNPSAVKLVEKASTRLKETTQDSSIINVTTDSILIFEALRECCRTESSKIKRIALDCLSKLFSFRSLDESLLINPPNSNASNDQSQEDETTGVTPPPKQRLIDAAINTIADCFQGEGTNEKVELQIIRALSSCVLVEDSISLCHGASLLKAIRTVYNIFVFSLNVANQGIAQATLTQMVNSVYEKIDLKKSLRSSTSMTKSSQASMVDAPISTNGEPLTLEKLRSLDDEEERIVDAEQNDQISNEADKANSVQNLVIKDAFLVFRTMAKICARPLESDLDMRSHGVRSKLLSLHIIYSLLKDHVDVFLSPNIYLPGRNRETFLSAIKQYLCLSLSRNAASPISPVFEITLEIMWLLIANLRVDFVREISVFFTEIYFPIAELATATSQQKIYFLNIMQRICNDPRTLIEFYLNYDCHEGMPNIMEKIVDYLTKCALTKCEITSTQRSYYEERKSKPLSTYNLDQLPLLTTSTMANISTHDNLQYPIDFAMKMTALQCIVSILRSLGTWAHKAINNSVPISRINDEIEATKSSLHINSIDEDTKSNYSQDVDNPTQFESLKQRKTDLSDCIELFNANPKKAIPLLVKKEFLADDEPKTIAQWLLKTDNLDMAAVGDFLGEGDDKNILIMHYFVDEFDFTGLSIVDALRAFLQKFRLPGEGQKIDRFMLKFAERFVEQNPGVFSKADTAYVLSYSLIMLNTDLHSTRIKHKMTLKEFLENNEGIDNGNDLPKEFLVSLFNEIANNEIKLLSEQHQAMLSEETNATQSGQQQSAFSFFSTRDLQREAYMQVSKEIVSKTELLFKNLKNKENDVYYAASHVEHVKSIFETLWMSFLAALTFPFKEYDDLDTTNHCLEGIKISIKISSIFGLDDARKSFIGALVQFCNLQNVEEISIKNVNAMVDLLEIALAEGNHLKESWNDILLVVSQIERLQLISKGIDRDTVPDVAQARITNPRTSIESIRTAQPYFFDIWSKRATPAEIAIEKHYNQKLLPEMAKYILSSELVVLMDNIFTKSAELTANSIVDFIKALTNVALDEIESSEHASTPRMFSLQKMVDVCYYNMDRIRLEWTPIWAVMGSAFNKIATNSNLAVVFFAIDSLRQLSMRFLDIEELSGFEFQHDFLKPFEYTIQNTGNQEVQEMIIECFRNFILLKSDRIKSGWKPILESLQYCAQTNNGTIIRSCQVLVTEDITKNHFDSVFTQEGGFFELVNVFREITKNKKHQKASLHALESLRLIIKRIAKICFYKPVDENDETLEKNKNLLRGKDIFDDVWFPILFCFNDTIMTAIDLEVRSRALNFMFDALVAYGGEFDNEFWERICNKLLFPIFGVLSKHWEVNQFNSHDDLSVWLSTTLIQALRNLIALFTHYFESLNGMIDGFLDLLVSCICQENDTIARIGRACLQQLIIQNVTKFSDEHWRSITAVFEKLFELTTANELFEYDPIKQGRRRSAVFDSGSSEIPNKPVEDNVVDGKEIDDNVANGKEIEDNVNKVVERAQNESRSKDASSTDNLQQRMSIKNTIVVKCILQLLMIELVSDLFNNEKFNQCIPIESSIKMTDFLQNSYEFAHDFNEDYGLRTRLMEARVVDKIPNLLKQETSAAAVMIDLIFKLYLNDDNKNVKLIERLVTICTNVVKSYILLDARTMERIIITWRPVIVEILQGYYEFDDEDFKQYCSVMYGLVIQILDKSISSDLRIAIKQFLSRVGELFLQLAIED